MFERGPGRRPEAWSCPPVSELGLGVSLVSCVLIPKPGLRPAGQSQPPSALTHTSPQSNPTATVCSGHTAGQPRGTSAPELSSQPPNPRSTGRSSPQRSHQQQNQQSPTQHTPEPVGTRGRVTGLVAAPRAVAARALSPLWPQSPPLPGQVAPPSPRRAQQTCRPGSLSLSVRRFLRAPGQHVLQKPRRMVGQWRLGPGDVVATNLSHLGCGARCQGSWAA